MYNGSVQDMLYVGIVLKMNPSSSFLTLTKFTYIAMYFYTKCPKHASILLRTR